ncbi:hypothetical protein AMTRI_Chr08g165310 [Amborella trichopoda]
MVSRSSEVVNNSKILVETLGFLVSKGFGLPYLLDLDQGGFWYQRDFRSLALVDAEASPVVRGGGWESEENVCEEEKLEEERFGARVGEIDLTTASCSFSWEKKQYLSKKNYR